MAGAEVANIKATWSGGALVITDLDGNAIITINPSTGGVAFANAGGITVSTGILAPTISTASLVGGATVSSGMTIDGQTGSTATAATTLAAGTHGGKIVKCATDGTFFTLPAASLPSASYTIKNTAAAAGAQIILITATGESIVGAGITTSNLLSNTKSTAKTGDYVTVIATGSTTSAWYVAGMVGTWISTT